MSSIDEIMVYVFMSQVHTGNFADGSGGKEEMDAADDRVRNLITAALADAEKRGAEAMREAMNEKAQAQQPAAWIRYQSGGGIQGPLLDTQIDEVSRQCWTPLVAADWADRSTPAGQRQAVRLTNEEVRQIGNATLYSGGIYDRVRAIETAVLAKNGLGDAA